MLFNAFKELSVIRKYYKYVLFNCLNQPKIDCTLPIADIV